jgi:nicotinamide-nucleotide amidase
MPDAEIIAVGSEMLTSQRIDTNSLFLTDQLNSLGVEVRRKLIIGDDRALLTGAVKHALMHVDVVILTGGLGPTEDDVTRDAVAAATNRGQVFNTEICNAIEARFRLRGRVMPEINKRQAYLIEGSELLPNANGTAPGQWLEHDGRVVILLPGPPSELKPLFQSECMPRLERRMPAQVIRTRFYRITGLTESDLDQLISPVYSKYTNPATTILAHQGDMQVHLRARCGTAEEAERLLEEVGGPIEALLGNRIYSRNGEALEQVIGGLLRERGETVSVAESCTGGMVGERITSIPGSSDYFLGGVLAYADKTKTRLLRVPPELIEKHSAVSEEVARAMAEGARATTGSTYAVSTTGEAGPQSSTGAVIGTVFIGFAGPHGPAEARRFQMPGGRDRVRGFATHAALDYLRRRLLAID